MPVASISSITGVVSVLFVNVCEAVNNAIAAVLDKSVLAIVILALPSKLCPAIVLAVSNAVAAVDNATAMRTAREQIYAVRKIDCFKDMAREVYQKLGSRKNASKRPRTSGNKAQPKLI